MKLLSGTLATIHPSSVSLVLLKILLQLPQKQFASYFTLPSCPPSGHLWISPHVKGCIVQVSSHVLQGPKGWANSIGWDETWRLFWDVNITWSWKLTSHWVFLAVLVVAVLLDQTFNWGFEKPLGIPTIRFKGWIVRCLSGTWRNKLLRLSVAFVISPREAHFIH